MLGLKEAEVYGGLELEGFGVLGVEVFGVLDIEVFWVKEVDVLAHIILERRKRSRTRKSA